MQSKIILVASFLLGIAVFSNCTVQKRHYRNGYYITKAHKTAPVENKASHASKPEKEKQQIALKQLVLSTKEKVNPESHGLFAAVKDLKKTTIYYINYKPKALPEDSCGDVILFRNGDELNVKIIGVDGTVLKYKRCDNLGGPTITTSTDHVFMVKHSNGKNEVFKQTVPETAVVQLKSQPRAKRTNGFAVASFICAMLSFLVIPGIAAFILGVIALKQMEHNPEKYKGKWMAVVGTIIGAITTGITLLVLFVSA